MADKVDEILIEYFNGNLQRKIDMRKRELQISHEVDENIGGGRAQNKHVRPLDDLLIRYERDPLIRKWSNQSHNIREWLKVFPEAKKRVLVLFYVELQKDMHQGAKTAVIELYALEHRVQVKDLYKWRNEFKKMVAPWIR